jgi:NADH:ubiquinone oxidoreductase subunit F (NADH-binding)
VKGVWGKPTNNNNVETYANVPQIIIKGADWYASMGTGTQRHQDLCGRRQCRQTWPDRSADGHHPARNHLRRGRRHQGRRQFKAVQTGGPMGGCLTEKHLDLPLDYEALTQAGSMMGSGGMVVMDETSCMVDIARFFMDFTQAESCGKCTPCRVGTRRILELLQKICDGKGEPATSKNSKTCAMKSPKTACAAWVRARPTRC